MFPEREYLRRRAAKILFIAEYKEECVLQCYDNWSGAVGHWLLAVEMSELLNSKKKDYCLNS